MAIIVPSGFKITAPVAVDSRLLMTKAEMLATDDAQMPEAYFTICADSDADKGKIFLYNKTNTPSATTGKFVVFEGGGGGGTASNYIVEATITSDTAFTTTAKPSELLAAYTAGKNLYFKATIATNQVIVVPITSVKTNNGVAVATFIDGVTNKEFTLTKPTSDDAYVGVIAAKAVTAEAPITITDGKVGLLYDDATIKKNTDTDKLFVVEMQGAETGTNGKAGLVPKPLADDIDKYLKGDGTWETMPQAMHFRGSLGTDGTIETLPAASASNEGDTYKVITAGTYRDKAYSVGDLAVSNGTAWVRIPSGDVPSGTVTNIVAERGLRTEDGNPITSTGKIGLDMNSAVAGDVLSVSEIGGELVPQWKEYVKVSETGAATTQVNYITVNGAEYKLGGSGSGPAEYLKSISRDDTSFTITDQDDVTTKVEFSATGTSTTQAKYVKIGNSELKLAQDVAVMGGASATSDGTSGLVPQPLTTDRNKFLKGDGSWATITSGTPTAYIKDASVGGSGNTNLVLTRQDGNTVEFNADVVSDVETGTTNGTLKVSRKAGSFGEVAVAGLQAAAYKDVDSTVTAGSLNLATSDAIRTAINELPQAMHFKGSLGTSGTITTLPTAAETNEGDTYRVITAGTYGDKEYSVGDLAISNGSMWVRIPCTEAPTGTVMSIKAGSGLKTLDGVNPITTSGEIQIDAEGIEAGKFMMAVGDGSVTWADAVAQCITAAEVYGPSSSETKTFNALRLTDQDGNEIIYNPEFSKVSGSATGTATDAIQYITIDGTEYLLATGGTSSLPEQTGHDGQFLMTNGENPSWQSMPKIYYQADQPASGVADKDLWAKKSTEALYYHNGTRVDADVVKFYKSVLGLLLIREDGIHDQRTTPEVVTPWSEVTDAQIEGYISSYYVQECAWNQVPTFGKYNVGGYDYIDTFSQGAAPATLHIYNATNTTWEPIGAGDSLGYDDLTIGKNGLDQLYVKDEGISYDKLDADLKAKVDSGAFQVTTLPTASASEVGKVYQYIGETDEGANLYFGYFYTCIENALIDPPTYSFEHISVQEGGGGVGSYDDVTINVNDDEELQVKDGGLTSVKMSTDFLKTSTSAMVASEEESDETIHSSKAIATAIEGFKLDAMYFNNEMQELTLDYYLPFDGTKHTLAVQNLVNTDGEQWLNNKGIDADSNTIQNIRKTNFSEEAIAEVIHSVSEASANKFVVESAVAGVLEGSAIQYTALPTASVSTVNRVVQYIGETTTTAPILTKGHFYVCVRDTATEYSWHELQVQTVYDATDSTNKTIALSANQGHTLFTLISAMAGVVKVKVVATQPTDTEAERNTIYYIGTAAPYTVKLFTKNEDEGPKWTDLGTTDINLDDYVNKHTDIVDMLDSTETEKPLSANQGRVLATMIGNRQTKVTYSNSSAPSSPDLGDMWATDDYIYYYTSVEEEGVVVNKWVKVGTGSQGIFPVMELPTTDISTTSFYKVEYNTTGFFVGSYLPRDPYILDEQGLWFEDTLLYTFDEIPQQWDTNPALRAMFYASVDGTLLLYRRRNDNTLYARFKDPAPNDAFRIYLYNYDTSSWMVVLDSECQAPYAQVNVEEWGAATRLLLLNKMVASVRGQMTFSSVKFASAGESPDGTTSTKFTVTVTKEDSLNATFLALTTSGKAYICGYVNAILGNWAQLRRTDDGLFTVNATIKKSTPILTLHATNSTTEGSYRSDIFFKDRNDSNYACIRASAENALEIGRTGTFSTAWYDGGLLELYPSGAAKLRSKAKHSSGSTISSALDLNSDGTFSLSARPFTNTSKVYSDTNGSVAIQANSTTSGQKSGLVCEFTGRTCIWGNKSDTIKGYMQVNTDASVELYSKSGSNEHTFKNTATGVSAYTLNGTINSTTTNPLKRSVNNSYLEIYGGSSYRNGAFLKLHGQDNGEVGKFELFAMSNGTSKALRGHVDGRLTWQDYQVLYAIHDGRKAQWTIPVSNNSSAYDGLSWETINGLLKQATITSTKMESKHSKIDKNRSYYMRIGKLVIICLTFYTDKGINDGSLYWNLPKNDTGHTVGAPVTADGGYAGRLEIFSGESRINVSDKVEANRWWNGQIIYWSND